MIPKVLSRISKISYLESEDVGHCYSSFGQKTVLCIDWSTFHTLNNLGTVTEINVPTPYLYTLKDNSLYLTMHYM